MLPKKRKMTASKSSRAYVEFKERIKTLKYLHAVAFSGQRLLHLILTTLLCGDIDNIIGCVKDVLKTNTQFKNSFTAEEHKSLEKGDHIEWDISLLFKVIQKACGLEPAGSSRWTHHVDGNGDEPLEHLITTIKDERNKMSHDFKLVLNEIQMEERLTKLGDLAMKVTSALEARAPKLGKQLSETESNETIGYVFDSITDVKGNINEGPPSTAPQPAVVPESVDDTDEEDTYESDSLQSDSLQSDSVQFDSIYSSAGVRGQGSQEPSWEKVIEDLTRKILVYTGPLDVVV